MKRAFVFEDGVGNKALIEGFVFMNNETDEEIEEARPIAMIVGMLVGCKLHEDVQDFDGNDMEVIVSTADIAGREVSIAFLEGPYYDEHVGKVPRTDFSN